MMYFPKRGPLWNPQNPENLEKTQDRIHRSLNYTQVNRSMDRVFSPSGWCCGLETVILTNGDFRESSLQKISVKIWSLGDPPVVWPTGVVLLHELCQLVSETSEAPEFSDVEVVWRSLGRLGFGCWNQSLVQTCLDNLDGAGRLRRDKKIRKLIFQTHQF